MDQNSPISIKRKVFINEVFRQEFRLQRIDYDMVCEMAQAAEYDYSDDKAAVIKLELDGGKVLVLQGFYDEDEFHVDDYNCQRAR